MHRLLSCVAIGLLGLAGPVAAVDGVTEINQACALAGTCTFDDMAGYPVTISTRGSYRLTGNLRVQTADTTAILVTGTPVTIDLNGFAILGPTDCTGAPSADNFVCAPLGTGMGIDANGVSLTVTNGAIMGTGAQGIRASLLSRIENVAIRDAGGFAIVTESGSVVRGNRIRECGGGIDANSGSVVNNSMSLIGDAGIISNGVVAENSIVNVEGHGIDMSTGVVRDNEVAFAKGFGLNGGLQVGYRGNVFRNNNSGDVFPQVNASPRETGTNVCGLTTTCP